MKWTTFMRTMFLVNPSQTIYMTFIKLGKWPLKHGYQLHAIYQDHMKHKKVANIITTLFGQGILGKWASYKTLVCHPTWNTNI